MSVTADGVPTASGQPNAATARHASSGTPAETIAGGRLPRTLTLLLGSAAAVITAGGIRAANSVVAPVLLALILTIAVLPVRRSASRHGWPSWAGTLAMMVTAYGIVVFLAASVSVSVVQLAATLPDYAPRADEITADVEKWLNDQGLSDDPTHTALSNLDIGKITGLLTDILGSLLGVLSGIFFLATVMFFVTVDAASAHTRVALLRNSRPAVVDAMREFTRSTQKYLLITALFGAIVAVCDTVALWLLGVPLPLLWGLLAFVTNFIPNIGFVIGLVPPALLALLDGGWKAAVGVLIVYCVLNVVIQTFIQPRFVGDAVGLNPSVTFLSLALWTLLLGPLGALLAVPATLLVRAILIDADPSAHWVRLIIGSTPTSTPTAAPKTGSKPAKTPSRTKS